MAHQMLEKPELARNLSSRVPRKVLHRGLPNQRLEKCLSTVQGKLLPGVLLASVNCRSLMLESSCVLLVLEKPRAQKVLGAEESAKAAGGGGALLTSLPKGVSARRRSWLLLMLVTPGTGHW